MPKWRIWRELEGTANCLLREDAEKVAGKGNMCVWWGVAVVEVEFSDARTDIAVAGETESIFTIGVEGWEWCLSPDIDGRESTALMGTPLSVLTALMSMSACSCFFSISGSNFAARTSSK